MKAAIFGAAGYTGGELIRLLRHHPLISSLVCVSESQQGKSLASVHEDLLEFRDERFVGHSDKVDLAFLCGAHGDAFRLIKTHGLEHTPIIDLSQDFRDGTEDFVYGLSEIFADRIARSRRVANPGCFATAIQLALAPLAQLGCLQHEIHVTAVTGSTGAGQTLTESSHFSRRSQNLSVYKAFEHQHLLEIKRHMLMLQSDFDAPVLMVPMRGPFTRGILASIYTRVDHDLESVRAAYEACYRDKAFVHIVAGEASLKQVVNSNNCVLSVEKHGPYIHVVSCIDNLLKGASGQAVQNMNLMFKLPEATGLRLKPSAF